MQLNPTNTFILCFFRDGISSMMHVAIVCNPPHPEEIAKLISMKKNRKLQSGAGSISSKADG